MELKWTMLHPRATMEMLGAIPGMLDGADPRPMKAQLHEGYEFAGGWRPYGEQDCWAIGDNGELRSTRYPEDMPYRPLASCTHLGETLTMYESAVLRIVHEDGVAEVTRMD